MNPKHYGTLAFGALGTMLDTGMIVVGTLLCSLGLVTFLGGFGLAGELELSTGAFLASGLLLGVVGLFALGIAAEGPLGRGRRLVGFTVWEIGIGRALASFIVGFCFLLLNGFLVGLVDELSVAIQRGVEGIHAAAIAGMVVVPLVGAPASMLLRGAPEKSAWARQLEYPVIFLVWVAATIAGL
jgi:hypothetical protein